MGITYDNIIVKGPSQVEIAAFLNDRGWVSYVSPTVGDITAVYDNEGVDIALALSDHFDCIALFVNVWDGNYLFYKLYQKGILLDAYCSAPTLLDEFTFLDPIKHAKYVTRWLTTGNAAALCQAFDVPDALQDVDRVLKHPNPWMHDYSEPVELWQGTGYHERLFAALRLPEFLPGINWSYRKSNFYMREWAGEYNNSFGFQEVATFVHTGPLKQEGR